jgi:hypothetical protein
MGLMDIRRRILADSPVLAEASGAIASFSTDMVVPLKKCEFSIEPVQSGTGDPSPSNVRPISGWTGANVVRCGKNLFSGTEKDVLYPLHLEVGTKVVASVKGQNTGIRYYDASKTQIDYWTLSSSVSGDDTRRCVPFTIINRTCEYVKFYGGSPTDFQIELGQTFTAYAPYTGNTYPVQFPAEAGTVYGGTVDVVSGVLTATWAGKTLDGTSNIRLWQACNGGNWFVYDLTIDEVAKTGIMVSTQVESSHFGLIPVISATTSSPLGVASAAKYWLGFTNEAQTKEGAQAWLAEQYTNGTPVQFVYVLDTPKIYQLTPQQITALKGINNIWHDANDNTTVKYWKH